MPTETLETIRLWAAPLLMLLSIGWTIYWSLTITRKAAAKGEQERLAVQLAELREDIKKDERADGEQFVDLKSRLQSVEEELKHLPTKDQLHSIEKAMGDMRGDVRELSASIRPLAASVERIINFMDRVKTQ